MSKQRRHFSPVQLRGQQMVPEPSEALKKIADALSSSSLSSSSSSPKVRVPSVYKAFGIGKNGGGGNGASGTSPNEPRVRAAVKQAAEFVKNQGGGRGGPAGLLSSRSSSFQLFDTIVDDLGGTGDDLDEGPTDGHSSSSSLQQKNAGDHRRRRKGGLEEFGIKSISLDENLIEGGLIIGRIKCDIDIWWT